MAFVSVKTRDGTIVPTEYYQAAAAKYQVGQTLTVTGGRLAASGALSSTPQYLCMGDVTVTGDEVIPVTRVSHDDIYEAPLNAAASVKVGDKLSVAADGVSVSSSAGTFEITEVSGTDAGDLVRGRFV